jgi:hypothetical protein
MHGGRTTSGEPNRRQFLNSGMLGAAAIGMWGQAALAAGGAGKAKAVILIFNDGAPSHIDLFDPKPEAPAEIRGPFTTIGTNVPGIRVTELLPRMARRMDKVAVVHGIHHKHSSHNSGMYWATVGRPYRVDSTLINPERTDLPSVGTLTGWLSRRDGYSGAVPPYVITPKPHCDSSSYLTPGQFGGCLGVKHDPFVLNADPNAKDFKVQNLNLAEGMDSARFEQRLGLMNRFSSVAPPLNSPAASELDEFNVKAAHLVRSGDAAEAFDLSKEPATVRDRYGRHRWGQSHLLARRLIERGSRFVTTVNGPSIIWDTHKDNFNKLRDKLVPPMERAYSTLLDDLEERGLLDTTLVVWMGEFGRTPTVNKDVGRDHWPACNTMLLAGGGIRGGQVIGSSDKIGAYPDEHPSSPADIHATMFAALGYDSRKITYPAADGRPIQLSDGKIIRRLFG